MRTAAFLTMGQYLFLTDHSGIGNSHAKPHVPDYRVDRLDRLMIGMIASELYGLCIMSNHVHYLLEPHEPEDLPRIMHWLNWYTAMCFNRMLKRTGHFWEERYFSRGFPTADVVQALVILRYIHANPKAAGMRQGFSYRYSNYGTYERLTDDGVTQWHPAFLRLGQSLDECAKAYRRYCRKYDTTQKPGGRRSAWGRAWLPELKRKTRRRPDASGPLLPFGGDWCGGTEPAKRARIGT